MLFNPSMSVISSDYNVVFCRPGKAKLKGACLTLTGGETEKGGRGGQEEGRWWSQEEESAVQHGGSLWRLPGQGQKVEHMLSYSRDLTSSCASCRWSRDEAKDKLQEKSRRRLWQRDANHWLLRTWGRTAWGQFKVYRIPSAAVTHTLETQSCSWDCGLEINTEDDNLLCLPYASGALPPL